MHWYLLGDNNVANIDGYRSQAYLQFFNDLIIYLCEMFVLIFNCTEIGANVLASYTEEKEEDTNKYMELHQTQKLICMYP